MNNGYSHIQSTEAIWLNTDQNVFTSLNKICIWRIKTSDFLSESKSFMLILNLEETERIFRYKSATNRETRIISRAVLRILLGRYLSLDPIKIMFELDLQKKPVLKNASDKPIHFNVSHSGDWILIAISANPIGIDLERTDASFTYQNLLDFSFDIEEKSYILKSRFPVETFYQLWTRKEALLKATGKGLVDELDSIPSLDGLHQNPDQLINCSQSWEITSFNIDENHIGSAAFMPVKTALQFLNFQL